MYLGRFLRVTLNTYQDTSRYMYLGRFVAIHQDTSGYKIKIHVSWARHDDTLGYIQDTSRYMYLGRFVRAALYPAILSEAIRIHEGYVRNTFRIHSRKADSRGWGLGGFVAYAAAESAGLFERDGWAM